MFRILICEIDRFGDSIMRINPVSSSASGPPERLAGSGVRPQFVGYPFPNIEYKINGELDIRGDQTTI